MRTAIRLRKPPLNSFSREKRWNGSGIRERRCSRSALSGPGWQTNGLPTLRRAWKPHLNAWLFWKTKRAASTSLDLSAGENLDLTRRLAESETRDDEVRSKLQSSEMTRTEYELAAAAAERKIELLQNLVRVKETRLQKLDQARKKLQQDTGKLLATTRARDQALAEAEHRISVLTELFEKLELSLETGKTEAASRDVHLAINSGPPLKASAPAQKPSRQSKLWQRALDTDDWLLAGPAARQN